MTVQEIINELNNSNIIPVALLIFFVGFFSYLFGKSQQFKEDVQEIITTKDIFRKREKTVKAEAIKEFADRLKEYGTLPDLPWDIWKTFADAVDNLVKEMVGEQK